LNPDLLLQFLSNLLFSSFSHLRTTWPFLFTPFSLQTMPLQHFFLLQLPSLIQCFWFLRPGCSHLLTAWPFLFFPFSLQSRPAQHSCLLQFPPTSRQPLTTSTSPLKMTESKPSEILTLAINFLGLSCPINLSLPVPSPKSLSLNA